MNAWQIILIVAAVWLAAAVVVCVVFAPKIARRLRPQHRAPERDREGGAPR